MLRRYCAHRTVFFFSSMEKPKWLFSVQVFEAIFHSTHVHSTNYKHIKEQFLDLKPYRDGRSPPWFKWRRWNCLAERHREKKPIAKQWRLQKQPNIVHWDPLNMEKSWFHWTFEINCQEPSHPSVFKTFNYDHSGQVELVLRRAVKQHHTESSCSYCITAYKIYNSVFRRGKDSSLEIYVGLMLSIAITSNITLVQLPQLVLYMAAISSGFSRDEKSISRCWTFITQSYISFLRTREPSGTQEFLWRSK